ncbi:sperm acrosome membrane-associated protein 6 [Urocitellus parryii]
MAPLSLVSAVPTALLALLVFRASTWACLLCFTSYAERFRLCKMWARGPRVEQCQEAFTAAFKGLSNVEISKDSTLPGPGPAGPSPSDYWERSHLQDAFTQMAHSLQEAAAAQGGELRQDATRRHRTPSGSQVGHSERSADGGLPVAVVQAGQDERKRPPLQGPLHSPGSFEDAFRAAAEEMKKAILQLKEGKIDSNLLPAPDTHRWKTPLLKTLTTPYNPLVDSELEPLVGSCPSRLHHSASGPAPWTAGVLPVPSVLARCGPDLSRPLPGCQCVPPPPLSERFPLQLDLLSGLDWPYLFNSRSCRLSPSGDFSGSNASPLSAVQPCVPPCGVQEVARRFFCNKCFSSLCKLPLDCPVQDVTVNRGEQAMFSCVVGFQLPPEEVTYTWKFAAGGMRTRDVSYFREVPQARGYLARIRPVQPKHRGTFSCVIKHDQRPLARLYFFLNVTGPPPRGETELQVAFREVVSWAPRDAEMIEPWRPSLGELLARPEALTLGNLCMLAAVAALASAMATVLVWMFFRWYLSGN